MFLFFPLLGALVLFFFLVLFLFLLVHLFITRFGGESAVIYDLIVND